MTQLHFGGILVAVSLNTDMLINCCDVSNPYQNDCILMTTLLLLSVNRLDTASHLLHSRHLNLTSKQVHMLLSHSSSQLLVSLLVSLFVISMIDDDMNTYVYMYVCYLHTG